MTDAANDMDSFAEYVTALQEEDGYYLQCPNDHRVVPPRRVCPYCQATELEQQPLPEPGEIVTYTAISAPLPHLSDVAPYVTAIADFGDLRITGLMREVDPETVAVGDTVQITGDEIDGDPTIIFTPAEEE